MPLLNNGHATPVTNGSWKGISTSLTPMGSQMRREHFLFEEGFVNLNHGVFTLHGISHYSSVGFMFMPHVS
jgi:hypothetical protein